jgi:hypothetical protein
MNHLRRALALLSAAVLAAGVIALMVITRHTAPRSQRVLARAEAEHAADVSPRLAVARDLADLIAQDLSLIAVQAAAATRAAEADTVEARTLLESVRRRNAVVDANRGRLHHVLRSDSGRPRE